MKYEDIIKYENKIGRVVSDNNGVFRFLPHDKTPYSSSQLAIINEDFVETATHEEKLEFIKQYFRWGRVVTIHSVGEFQIIEYINNIGERRWHCYSDYIDLHRSYSSLDVALVGCIGIKHEGPNGNAAMYFSKMVGINEATKCDCCEGDTPFYWLDNENNAFIDSKGEMLVVVKDKTLRFKVKYCPNCGRKFDSE